MKKVCPALALAFLIALLTLHGVGAAELAAASSAPPAVPSPSASVGSSSPPSFLPEAPSLALATPAVAANTEAADATPLAPTADASSTTGAEVLHAAGARLQRGYGQLPMRFEPNQGQADAAAKFLARGPGYQLFLTDDEAVLVLRQAQPARPKDKLLARRELTPAPARGPRPHLGEGTASTTEPPSAPGTPQPVAGSAPDTQALAQTPPAVIRMRLEGTNRNPAPALTGQEHLPGYSNYFIGKDPAQWRTRVPHYGKVRYSEVYPGIDLVYYGNPQQLEYDFVLAPGADPGLIQLSYSGIERLEIDEAGDLLLHVPGGRLVQRAPRLYQLIDGERQPVEGRYVLRPRTENQVAFQPERAGEVPADDLPLVGFQLAQYRPELPLVIDPVVLSYSTFLGGSSFEYGDAIAVDEAGTAYVTGETNSLDFPVTANAAYTDYAGSEDAFVAKLNAAGSSLVYATYLGGSYDDRSLGIAVDGEGQAYVTGFTYSDDFPVTPGAVYPDYANSVDAFVARLSADGTALGYSTYLGGNSREVGTDIAVDGSGQAYITGETESSDFPVTAGAADPGLASWQDAFVARLSADGTALGYSTYLGGNSDEEGNGIAVDDSGQAYITGYTWSTDFPVTAGAAYPSIAGDSDIFVAKLNATGSALDYATYLGGDSYDIGIDIAVDDAGQVYVTGQTSSFNFPVTANAAYPACPGNGDAFVAKLNAAGSDLDYATYLGGSYDDFSLGIAVDSRGMAYVTGTTASSDFPTRYAPYPARVANTDDAFVAALHPDGGGLVYATFLGGSGSEEGTGLALDAGGNAYVTGYTWSNDFPTSAGAVDTNSDYSSEAFVAKFTIDGKLLLVTRTGAGSGLVSSTLPDGTIDCGPVCSAIYPTSTTAVRLLAGTQPLSTFGGWGGDCASAGTSLTCNLTLTGDKTVSARFEPRTDDVAISQGLDLDQSQPGIDWYQAGSAPWFAQDRVTQDGIDAAQSGAIGDGQSSELEATLTGPAYLSFWWKVSSEQGWDYLTFYLDGVEQAAITGKTDWAQVFINVPAGSHSLTWAYEKDANGQAGQDAGWLDQVVFDNADRTLVIDPPVGGTISGATSGSYTLGTALTLVAEAGAGHYFAGWGGDCADAGLANTCELTLYTDKHVSASFPALLQGKATDVAAGGSHSCAVADGGVRCWGENGSGQLGNGSTLDSPVPVQAIPAGSGATAVAAGYSHSCAIVNGGVMCWGDGGSGRLGNGTYESSSTPVQTIPAGSGASAVAAGGQHSCAVVNGGVMCWGDGGSGRLGNGTYESSSTPVQAIAAGKGVTAIAAGDYHSCAVVNGGVKCWGYGWYGRLGNGSDESSSTPVQAIPAGSGTSAVAAGGGHSCAVVNGGVKCWGYGGNGELGNGSSNSSFTPVQAIPAGSGATAVAAGGSHSCAVVAGGVQCWGNGWSGQLGNGSYGFNSLTPVLAIPAGSGASDIAAGGNHSCAVVAGGVHCWGNNDSSQLGDGTQDSNARPQPVIGLASDLGPGIPVTATAGPGGSISPMWVNVPSGETATFTLSLDPGHSIDSVTGCDGSLSGFSYTTGAITAPCAVSATFSANSYAITTNANPEVGGTVTCDPNPVAYGGGSRCTARVASGYGFVNWGGDCSGSSPTCALSTITGPREVTANFVDLSATLAVTHSAPAYQAGGLLRVNARLNDSSGATPLSLLWRPTLPTGWVLTSVTGDGAPELNPDASEILFQGSLTAMPLDFSFQVAVPAGASGPQTIDAIVEYQNSSMTNPVTLVADPNPMTLDGGGYHSADYRNPRWQIDSTEANRVLAYWRAAAYHVEPTGDDGYASGTGSTERNRHSADYRDPFWQIDSSEANRVLAYWRAAAYHADPTGDDGFAAGTLASGLEVEVPNTAPTATHSAPSYVPGGTLTVTNSLAPPADGTLLGLLWTPSLPAGWTISAVSGDGTPEVGPDGAILFTATSLTTKPLQFTYQVTVPTGTTGSQNLSAQVEYLMNGAVNPQRLSAQPQPLVLEMSTGQDLTIAGADVPTTGSKTFNASGKITVLGDVIVRSGVQVTLKAGKKIAFLPGFKVNAGGRLSARIGSGP